MSNGEMVASRTSRIEERIDKAAMGQMAVSNAIGGVSFQSMTDLMEFAKLMAISDICVPKHLRGNPGACLAICMQAVEWRMSPYAVANKSYTVNDRIGYESQLIHAVIEQRAPLAGRMRCRYIGEGPSRQCIVTAKVRGEDEPYEFTSAPFAKIQPKNSPLWQSKPDLQLFYNASRDWARMYFPDLILGVYADDELDSAMPTVTAGRHGGVASVAAKMLGGPTAPVPHPADPNLTIDTRDASDPPPTDDQTDPDVSGADTATPDGVVPDVSNTADFYTFMSEMAQRDKVDAFDAAMERVRLINATAGESGKAKAARRAVAEAAMNRKLDWESGRVTV